ncbi:MAG TPA: radical SAM protein [Blastocatellia bacterium]|nr:radical SAM protein [Blastocatellia bacterium]
MKTLLLHPPMDDPTLPYHSMAYLAGHALHNGFTNVSMRDVNVEFVNYCLEEDSVLSFYEEWERRLSHLESRSELNFREQEEYYGLWVHNKLDFAELSKAVDGFRSKEAFLDFPAYLKRVNLMLAYFGFIGALSYPSEIAHFRQMSRARYSVYHLNDLLSRELAERICAPFSRFVDERLCHDPQFADTECFGISIIYDHQLCYALHLARALKRRWPEKKVIFGGTSISQLYKYLKDKSQMKRFFDHCDAIVVGEGETAICEIADCASDSLLDRRIPNTITYNPTRDELRFPQQIHYENVNELGPPSYDYRWELYLSPERGINYAPTRGCYWNRCTFCDYGLNTDSPTSPWRERKIERVVEDIRRTKEVHGARYVYFAVDVMAPGYIERLSDAIIDSGLDIRWASELRMEKIFSPERCEKMIKSGCVCISFGMESGNQRILDLIDKGTKVSHMAETMKNFASAGVAVQLMAFTDFPTETPAEKNETFNFVQLNRDHWSTGGMGSFLLTGTSIIAKNPEQFGIELIDTKDADVARAIAFRVGADNDREVLLTEDSDASFDGDGGVFPKILGRPWAGGTDTLHSMVYYDQCGRTFFKDNPIDDMYPANEQSVDVEELETDEDFLRCTLAVPGKLNESHFDISRVLKNRLDYLEHIKELVKLPAEPNYANFCEWEREIEPVMSNGDVTTYWITAGNKCAKVEKLVYRIVSLAVEHNLSLDEVLSSIPAEMKSKLIEYFKQLQAKGLIDLRDPNRMDRKKMDYADVEGPVLSEVGVTASSAGDLT